MKNIFIESFVFMAVLFFALTFNFGFQSARLGSGLVFAEGEPAPTVETVSLPSPIPGANGGGATLQDIIKNISGFIFWLGITISPIFIVWGGFLVATANGEQAKISQGRQIITYAIVGLVIIAVSNILVSGVQAVLGS